VVLTTAGETAAVLLDEDLGLTKMTPLTLPLPLAAYLILDGG
jgi:hypothetical protein